MDRIGVPTIAELMALLAAKAAEVETLQAERDALARRILKLEEELALARLHRFAPRSEKHLNRVFNEAEQASLEDDTDDGHDDVDEPVAADLPDTGLPEARKPEGKKRGRKPLLPTCRASASNMTSPTTRRSARAAASRCIAWGKR